MPDIMLLLTCLSQSLDNTNRRRFICVVEGMLSMTGRVTMRGLSRWTERGGSYRTLQRFFNSSLSWGQLHWLLIRQHLLGDETEWLLAGDEVVVTKSGKKTHGLDRFFSSIFGKTVPGLCFLSLSLISVERRCSYPLRLEPIIKEAAETCPKAPKGDKDTDNGKSKSKSKGKGKDKGKDKGKGKGPGRPKGSTNRNRREVSLSPYLQFVQGVLRQVLALVSQTLTVRYFVFDGAFGHNQALQMVQQTGLELMSKLRHNAALHLPYDGPYGGRGRRRKYGAQLDYRQLPAAFLKATSVEGHIHTALYQMNAWHKTFPDLLNMVIIVKTNQHTGAQAHVVLFSSDLDLGYEKLIDSYHLRFQIEIYQPCNLRKTHRLIKGWVRVAASSGALPVTHATVRVRLNRLGSATGDVRNWCHGVPSVGLCAATGREFVVA
ncbi:MAG: transposase [Alphaproteobacteria bacterium]|nr:transposase [Alphaproteobacteria bacterium]